MASSNTKRNYRKQEIPSIIDHSIGPNLLKSKKKGFFTGKRIIAILIIIGMIYLIGHYTQPSPSSTTPISSSATSAITALRVKDFQFDAFGRRCETDSTGGRHYLEFAQLGNVQGIPFHFINATMVLINITLSNGKVVIVNQTINQEVDTAQTYGAHHQIPVGFTPPSNLPSNLSITDAEFNVTAFVQEVLPDPVILPLSIPTPTC